MKSSGRARMLLETKNLNLYVHYNVPTVEEWDSRPAVEIWITSRSRRCKNRHKGRKQTYFKAIFLQSHEESNDQDQPTRKRKRQFWFCQHLGFVNYTNFKLIRVIRLIWRVLLNCFNYFLILLILCCLNVRY